jgi:hypothetical protein
MEYVALEIGRGGPRQLRSASAALCRNWNQRLEEAHPRLRLRPGFGGTGNYLLSSQEPLGVSVIALTLQKHLEARFAVFVATDFVRWVGHLKLALATSNAPKNVVGRRSTPGAVIDVNPEGDVAPPLPIPSPPRDPDAWTSSEVAFPRIRGVWKNDILGADGKNLDPDRREGTWGALAGAMQRAYGGDWTARALSTLEGLSKKAEGEEGPADSLRKTLSDPSLIRLYRELSADDVAMAEEGLAEYRRQVNASDA